MFAHSQCAFFYLEAWTKVNGRLSCIQMKCSWILPSFANEVEYARVRDINFKSAKKMKADLDATIENLPDDLQLSADSKIFTGSLLSGSETGSASADTSGNGKLLF